MYNIGNLHQIMNTLNGMVVGLRTEIETLKNEVITLKAAQSQTPIADASSTSTGVSVEDLETRITKIQTTLDSALVNTNGYEKRIDNLEKSLSDKVLFVHQLVNDKDKQHKHEVQSMIDQSIALLLDGLRPPSIAETTTTTIHENPAFAPLTSIDEGEESSDIATTSQHDENSSQVSHDVVETPKPKGRGGRKKKVVQ